MDARRKAELKRAYKQTVPRKGVFKVVCSTTGQTWVDTSTNLDTIKNRIWFSLGMGNHRNRQLQQAWNEADEQAMQYAVVEVFDDTLTAYALERMMKERKQYWMDALKATSCL